MTRDVRGLIRDAGICSEDGKVGTVFTRDVRAEGVTIYRYENTDPDPIVSHANI